MRRESGYQESAPPNNARESEVVKYAIHGNLTESKKNRYKKKRENEDEDICMNFCNCIGVNEGMTTLVNSVSAHRSS